MLGSKGAIASILTAAAVTVAAVPADANMFPMPGNARYEIKVKSLFEMRYKNVVRQQHDLSCGAAALATLMKFFYAEKTDEKQIIDAIFKYGDKEKIKKDGFSMLELKQYGQQAGYAVRGFRVTDPKKLSTLKIPAITLINTRGYNHFVVIKGVKNGQVFIADPAFGNSSKPIDTFIETWSKVILVYFSANKGGNSAFTLDPIQSARKGEVILLLDRSLYTVRPGTDEM